MKYYKITYANGDHETTGFNGDIEAARGYYLGKTFNIGTVNDNLQKCVAVEEIRPTVDAWEVLTELEKFRQKHQNDKQHPADWCMRCMEAIVAKAAGYKDRLTWYRDIKPNLEEKEL